MPFVIEEDLNSGDSIELNCYVSKGDKPVTIKWNINGKDAAVVPGVSEVTKDRSSLLTISNVMAIHNGNLTCTATNRAGSSSYHAELHVNGIFFIRFLSLFQSFLTFYLSSLTTN